MMTLPECLGQASCRFFLDEIHKRLQVRVKALKQGRNPALLAGLLEQRLAFCLIDSELDTVEILLGNFYSSLVL